MPSGVGYYGDPLHDQIVQEIVDLETFYRQQLETPFQDMVRYWRLYFADRADTRKAHEREWRANTFVPDPYSATESKVAALVDIMNSADPLIQAEGVGVEDEARARKTEAMLSYGLAKIRWPYLLDRGLRTNCVQGTHVWKMIYGKRARRVRVHPTSEQVRVFRQALEEAQMRGAPPPPVDDPAAFAEWRQMVNDAKVGEIPDLPYEGEQEIIEYRGPVLLPTSIYDLRFDPFVDDWQEQECIIHRIVKPKKWLLERTGDGIDMPYDPRQVGHAIDQANADKRFMQWEEQVAQMLGLTVAKSDPLYRDSQELWEVWRPGTSAPYCVILNRCSIINKTPDKMPFWDGEHPFVAIRNVPLERRALGLSDYKETEKLFLEQNALHDLWLDAVLLAVLPVFQRRKDSGIPEMARRIRPGAIWDVAMKDAISAVTKFDPGLQHALPAMDLLKENINETMATQPQIRGQQAEVGRVSATESERRYSQALLRQKALVLRLEQEMQSIPRKWLYLMYQFGPEVVKTRVGGDENRTDPFVTMRRDEFLEALEYDFKFVGASKALNRELQAQQLKDLLMTAVPMNLLAPKEARIVLRRVFEILGQKGTSLIFSAEGDQAVELMQQTIIAQAVQQLRMQQTANQEMQIAGGGPPPVPQGAPAGNGEAAPEEVPVA